MYTLLGIVRRMAKTLYFYYKVYIEFLFTAIKKLYNIIIVTNVLLA